MKTTLLAVMLMTPVAAHSESWFEFEAGVGFVHQQHAADGIWYWTAGEHSMKTNGVGVRTGLQLNLSRPDDYVPGVRMHATYYNFGRTSWVADAGEDAPPDKSYGYNHHSGTCYNMNCGEWRRFTSAGNMQAIALTVEPFWRIGNGWDVGIEFGPALFYATWSSTASALATTDRFGQVGSSEVFTRKARWQFGQIVGVSVGKGPLTLRYNYLRAPGDGRASGSSSLLSTSQYVPSGVIGQHMVSINYNF